MSSCFGEYTVVPEKGAVVIPREMRFEQACTIGCSVTTGVASVTKVAKAPAGSSIAVVDCGPVGLNALQGAALAGARTIVAIDPNSHQRSLALQFGTTHAICPLTADVMSEIRALTNGRGVDYCFEAAGREASIQSSLEITRPGGDVLILSKLPLSNTCLCVSAR